MQRISNAELDRLIKARLIKEDGKHKKRMAELKAKYWDTNNKGILINEKNWKEFVGSKVFVRFTDSFPEPAIFLGKDKYDILVFFENRRRVSGRFKEIDSVDNLDQLFNVRKPKY